MIATDRLFRDLVGGHAAVVAERLPFGHGDLDGDEVMDGAHVTPYGRESCVRRARGEPSGG